MRAADAAVNPADSKPMTIICLKFSHLPIQRL